MADQRTPLQRLAEIQATPVPKKMVPVVKPVKTVSSSKVLFEDPNDPLGILGPSPATTVPDNKAFVGPTLDPDVIKARQKLSVQANQALQAGVPPDVVQLNEAGKGDPNRGFLGPARWLGNAITKVYSIDVVPGAGKIQPFVKAANFDIIPGEKEFKPIKGTGKVAATLGVKALIAASPALDKLDFGRRFVTSTLKEIGDEVAVWRGTRERGQAGQGEFRGKGGFSASDWWNQLSKEGGISGGEFFADVKNPYLNQLLGFSADVFLDPVTYVAGPAGIGETAVERGVISGATRQGEKLAARAAAAKAEQFSAAMARKAGEEALDFAVRTGDDVAAKLAEEAIVIADKKAAAAAKALAGDAAGRTLGRTSNQALAEKVLGMRDEAQRVLDLGTASADELAYAQRTVDVLNDEVIANIQKSGLAGIAGPIWDIARGKRTAAQDVLGVRGGLRITNPLAVFGGPGPLRAIIPGTERITNIAGKLIAESRLGLGRTPLGIKIVNNITPTGEGGLLGSKDLLEMRTGLRLGKLSPQEAQEATRLLQLDQQYRALVQNERKIAGGYLAKSGIAKNHSRETLNEVIRLRQVAAMTGTPVAFNAEQQAAADAIDAAFDYFYNYAAKASGGTGYIPPRRTNYFPQMQSDEAIRWAQKNPKQAEQLAQQLKVDRTWFVGNFRARELQAGDKFFGKVLTQADIDGGAQALNEIARKWGLKFDYFETDALTVIGKYAQKHAQFSALQKTIGALPENLPSMAARQVGPEFVSTKATTPLKGRPGALDFYDPNFGLPFDGKDVLSALDTTQLQSLLDEAKNISLATASKTVSKEEIEKLFKGLSDKVEQIADDYANGVITPVAQSVLTDEAKKLAESILQEIQKIPFNIESVPATRWTEYYDIVKKGFEILNGDVIDPLTGNVLYKGTAPDIAVREVLADLLRNAERVKDPEFAARARQLVKDYTRFSKAWLVARPGFHTRNAFSNVFQLIAAGADPRNLRRSITILGEINKGLAEGLSPRQIAAKLYDDGIIKVVDFGFADPEFFKQRRTIINAIEDSINYSGSTGFGQFGEIAQEVGIGNRGILQKGAPRNKASAAAGKFLQWNRKAGETIENYSRFGLMWDGMMKGLSPSEAVARSNKFLIDYADASTLDKVAKQIVPFWTFMARNTPLQLELMWTNPRAYAFYSNLKRNIEGPSEEQGGIVIPSYEKDRGVFPLKTPIFGQNVIRPGLPFPGGGENVIGNIITNPKQFFAQVNPIFRVPIEVAVGKKAFTGAPIAPKGEQTTQTKSRLIYLGRELFSPASPIAAVLKSIPGVGQSNFMAEYFGVNPDDAEPMVQTANSILSLFGAPIGTQRTEASVRELQSRWYDLQDYITDAQNKKKEQQQQSGGGTYNPTNPDDPLGILGP